MARKKENERVTYRELRNTPGRVWERLAADQPLTLMAEGEAKAILIPVAGGDVAAAYEAYERGRALMALRSIQDDARRRGGDRMSLADINKAINDVRQERRAAEAD
ncbi:MAG: hypothetical protein WD043_05900 [Gemmatimonadales bacterium]